jgi:DNA-directed RNA polymerase subunit RPC12/RpoP
MIPESEQKVEASLIEEYLGIRRKTLLVFAGFVTAVWILVAGIYAALFGFDAWATNMRRAGSMMVIRFDSPPTGTIQYVCPRCGAVGLPSGDPQQGPRCPICGGRMTLAGRP